MKILIIQLARYGDILQTYPAVKALRKQYPSAQLHVLVRDRFRHAATELAEASCVFAFPTKFFLEPLLMEDDLLQADTRLSQWIDDVRDYDYDRVINLTYSPLSSFLTHALARPHAQVSGYSRHADGQFALTDTMSCYFYSEVGTDGSNRKSLAELLCCACQIPPEIYAAEVVKTAKPRTHFDTLSSKDARVTIHVDSSHDEQGISFQHMSAFVEYFATEFKGDICLVGAKNPESWAESIAGLPLIVQERVDNQVGKTKFAELFEIARGSTHIIGFDTVMMQIGFLTQTPCFMLSAGTTNFFETAPRVTGTTVYHWATTAMTHGISDIVQDLIFHLRGAESRRSIATWSDEGWIHSENETIGLVWTRELLETLYFRGRGPQLETSPDVHRALNQLVELGNLAVFQLDHIKAGVNSALQSQILERIDETILSVSRVVPLLKPLTTWFVARRLTVGPADENAIIQIFKNIYIEFINFCEDINQESADGTLRVG